MARQPRTDTGSPPQSYAFPREGAGSRLFSLVLGLAVACSPDKGEAGPPDSAASDDSGSADGGCSADELACNGIDDDCDGVTDEAGEQLLLGWLDADGDGHGGGSPLEGCAALGADRWTGGDCDDGDPAVFPGAWDQVGDGIDSDCDGRDRTCVDGGTRPAAEGDVTLDATSADALCAAGDWIQGAVVVDGSGLTDLHALSCICEIEDGLAIHGADALESLDGLPPGIALGLRLDLRQLPALRSIAALGEVQWVPPLREPARIVLQDLPALPTLSGLDGIDALDDLSLAGELDPALSLEALGQLSAVHETLDIRDTPLGSLAGLESVALVGELRVDNAPGLSSLAPLSGVRRVRFLTLQDLRLSDLGAFSALARIDRRLALVRVEGIASLAGLDSLEVLGGIELVDNPSLTTVQGLPPTLDGIGGDLSLQGNPGLETLDGLDNLTWLGGSLHLGGAAGPTALRQLSGLGQIRFLGGSLAVANAPRLPDLGGLDALEEVGGDLWATTIYSAAPRAFSFGGLPALHTVHGTVRLVDHDTIVDLSGLERVHTVGALELEQNPSLRTLTGLEGLRSLTDLRVVDNSVLDDISNLYNLTAVPGSVCIQLPASGAEPEAWLESIGRVNGC